MNRTYQEEIDPSQDGPENSLLSIMLRERHKCNPDFSANYGSVVRWLLEVDLKEGRVLREIGLNETGQPIVFGPFGRNNGLWTAVSIVIGIDHHAPRVEEKIFQEAWRLLEQEYKDCIPPAQLVPRIPISDPTTILGEWSAAMLDGPWAGFSDQVVSFFPNGAGFFEDYNVALMYYEEFEWKITEPGRIAIRGLRHFAEEVPGDSYRIVETPSDFHYDNLIVETQLFRSPTGEEQKVLHLPLRNDLRPWVGDVYGRTVVPLSKMKQPSFE